MTNNVTMTTTIMSSFTNATEEEEPPYYNYNYNNNNYYNEKDISTLSTRQQKILSVVVLIPSVLSIVGSSIILHLVVKERKNTPYRRILFMLSLCDIIATTNYALSPYLMPSSSSESESSDDDSDYNPNPNAWVWAVGNQATCTMLGTITQFGFSTQFYCGLLSLYFVLTIRKGMKQRDFSRWIEPSCHVWIMFFSITTALVGAIMGFYDVVGLGQGCWVNNWPDNCGSDPEDTGGDCKSEFIAWIFGGLPSMTMLIVIIVNNLLLYCHVRSTILRGSRYSFAVARSSSAQTNNFQQQQQQQQQRSFDQQEQDQVTSTATDGGQRSQDPSDQPDHHHQQQQSPPPPQARSTRQLSSSVFSSSITSSLRSLSTRRQQQRRQSVVDQAQLQRIRAVGTQSFLYVSAYLLTYVFSWTIRIAESLNVSASDSSTLFPLLLLQNIFLPLQGFLNLLVYLRPPYMRSRKSFPRETRFWCVRRALYGQVVRPQKPSDYQREMLDTQSCSKIDIQQQ